MTNATVFCIINKHSTNLREIDKGVWRLRGLNYKKSLKKVLTNDRKFDKMPKSLARAMLKKM